MVHPEPLDIFNCKISILFTKCRLFYVKFILEISTLISNWKLKKKNPS